MFSWPFKFLRDWDTVFLPTISIQYQADKWWEQGKSIIGGLSLVVHSMSYSPD